MNSQNSKSKKRIATIALSMALCLSLVAGMAITEPAYAFTGGSPFIGNTYTHNNRYTGNVVANGVDVSWWQSDGSNWSTAKSSGVDYAIIRATYTGTDPNKFKLANDSRFANHYARAKAAGIMTGVYHFSQAKNATEGKKEAEFVIARLKALGIGPNDLDLPVYFDYEFNSRLTSKNLSRSNGTAAANAFCAVVRSNGYQPGIYANLTFFRNYLDVNSIGSDVDMWCAQYNSSCGLASRYSKWQYTSSGKINGILNYLGLWKSSVDCNFWYLDPNSRLGSGATVSGGTGSYNYTGAPVQPSVTVTKGGKTLKAGIDYKVGYLNNVKPGQAYVYVRGIGSYAGYQLIPFTIKGAAVSVPATKIKSLKGKKQSFYIRVAKKSKSKVSGYQVKYSRNADMTESVKKTIGKKYNKVKKTIKTNARKRYYYVQVRSYKKINGKKYYSDWSKVKRVKVK